jgi:hypothetical protein
MDLQFLFAGDPMKAHRLRSQIAVPIFLLRARACSAVAVNFVNFRLRFCRSDANGAKRAFTRCKDGPSHSGSDFCSISGVIFLARRPFFSRYFASTARSSAAASKLVSWSGSAMACCFASSCFADMGCQLTKSREAVSLTTWNHYHNRSPERLE